MKTERWIKLYEKLLEHEILKDHKALVLFIYLLLKADYKTGTQSIGRFEVSGLLGMKPSTFYKTLSRISKKYDLVTLKSNNRFTEYRVLNWAKYQGGKDLVTQVSRNKVETNEKQSNTLQEYKNKELKNNTKVLQTVEFGNPQINEALSYMKEKLGLPALDETVQTNRNYTNLLLKKFGGIEQVKLLIDATATHDFWGTRVTSMKTLYYKGVNIISSSRDKAMTVTKL